MKLDSKSNLLFRLVQLLSYLVFIWYPTLPYLFIFPILFYMLDQDNKNKRFKMLAALLFSSVIFYFYLSNLDLAQQIAISLVLLFMGFSNILKITFKKILFRHI